MKRAPEGSGQAMRVSSHKTCPALAGGGMIVMASSPESSSGQAMWQKNKL